uniref:Uncharacterized protein n=1 Tax=uncultured bacterium A1Q1_fos_1060 TaxID=1256540 RepID=L7VYP0_9BACT|nr:hypothetical protein [uncultured bacterium A1Q1_fos_1060]
MSIAIWCEVFWVIYYQYRLSHKCTTFCIDYSYSMFTCAYTCKYVRLLISTFV